MLTASCVKIMRHISPVFRGPSGQIRARARQIFLRALPDVWELEVSYLEDSYIREVALGGSDTATRSEVIWRIRSALLPRKETAPPAKKEKPAGDTPGIQYSDEEALQYLKSILERERGFLKAKVVEPREDDKTPCTVPPTSRYRGLENQLYRVEIHEGGSVSDGQPTFKWSRENGSILFAIEGEVVGGQNLTTLTLTLRNLGRDDVHYGLQLDDWVEIVDRKDALDDIPGPLFRVDNIDYASRQVTIVANSSKGVTINTGGGSMKTPFLRRWDYRDIDPSRRNEPQLAESGALKLVENRWLVLENGIEIMFYRDEQSKEAPVYRTRDYWLIPARVATGRIEWPHDDDEPEALDPHGVAHHYAPLALARLRRGVAEGTDNPHDLRRKIKAV